MTEDAATLAALRELRQGLRELDQATHEAFEEMESRIHAIEKRLGIAVDHTPPP